MRQWFGVSKEGFEVPNVDVVSGARICTEVCGQIFEIVEYDVIWAATAAKVPVLN